MLVARRNARVKLACEEKPDRNAISLRGNLPTPIIFFAASRRRWLTYRCGGMPIVAANIRREMEYAEVRHLREVVDSEFFLEVLVDVVQDTPHSGVIERMAGIHNAIDQVSIDVILDQACCEHKGGHLRNHAAGRGSAPTAH